MDSKGYDFVLVGKEIKEFRCSLCKLLLREATELPCTHINCQSCLWQWQMTPEAKAGDSLDNEKEFFHCPTCNASYSLDQSRQSTVTDRVITSSLDVKCIFSQDGCEWTGTITDFQEHKLQCNYTPANCPFEGCREMLKRNELEEHKKKCPYRVCEKCGGKLQECSCTKKNTIVDDDGENEEECERANKMVKCPYMICDAYVKHCNLINHIKKCGKCNMYELNLKVEKEKNEYAFREARDALRCHRTMNNEIEVYKRKIEEYKCKINLMRQNLEVVKSGNDTVSYHLEPSVKKPNTSEEAFEVLKIMVEENDFNHIPELLSYYPDLSSLRGNHYYRDYKDLVNLALGSQNTESLLLLLEHKTDFKANEVSHEAVKILRSIRNSSAGVIRMLTFYNNEMINCTVSGETVLRHAVGQHSQNVLLFLLNQPNIDLDMLCDDGKKSDDASSSFKPYANYIKLKRKIGHESFFEKLGFS